MKAAKVTINSLIFFAVILGVYIAVTALLYQNLTYVSLDNGVFNLADMDLSREIAVISDTGELEFYPEKLYDPGDITDMAAPRAWTSDDEKDTQFGTFRMKLTLPKGNTYALAMRSANFSQNIFVDGVSQHETGIVGDTKESVVPRTEYVTVCFKPDTDVTEVVIQYANFNHRAGRINLPVYVSETQNILRRNQISMFSSALIAGCMFTIFVFYLGMFFFFDRKKHFISFAACCLAMGIRTLIIGDKAIMALIPNLNWFISLGLEYLLLIAVPAVFILFMYQVYPQFVDKPSRYFVYIISVVYAVIVLFTLPLFYSKLLLYYQISVFLADGYIWVKTAVKVRRRGFENIYILGGSMIFLMGGIYDMLYFGGFIPHRIGELTPVTMMICAYASMIAIAIQFYKTERSLVQTQQSAEFAQGIISSGRDHYQKMNEMYDTLAAMRHDYKYQLKVIRELANAGDLAGIKNHLSDVEVRTPETELQYFCSNSVLNALLGSYAERCAKLNIRFDASLAMPDNISIPNYDLCIIFGNLMENAVEACEKKERRRRIELSVKTQGTQFAVMVRNSFDGAVKEENGHPVSTKKDGGVGLKSVRAVSDRYDGHILTQWDSDTFTIYVMLQI